MSATVRVETLVLISRMVSGDDPARATSTSGEFGADALVRLLGCVARGTAGLFEQGYGLMTTLWLRLLLSGAKRWPPESVPWQSKRGWAFALSSQNTVWALAPANEESPTMAIADDRASEGRFVVGRDNQSSRYYLNPLYRRQAKNARPTPVDVPPRVWRGRRAGGLPRATVRAPGRARCYSRETRRSACRWKRALRRTAVAPRQRLRAIAGRRRRIPSLEGC